MNLRRITRQAETIGRRIFAGNGSRTLNLMEIYPILRGYGHLDTMPERVRNLLIAAGNGDKSITGRCTGVRVARDQGQVTISGMLRIREPGLGVNGWPHKLHRYYLCTTTQGKRNIYPAS